jgi:hypothetical protein
MKFKVMELSRQDEKSGKIGLEAKDGRTIYISKVYLYVPLEELSKYRIDQSFELIDSPEEVAEEVPCQK